ncbi:double zinc ribbon domain-containing protein [Lachnospiraceae bacterium JLR.KK008]
MRLSHLLLELLFPRRCPVCDGVQPLGQVICPSCADSLQVVRSPFCRKCGKPLANERQEYCGDCAGGTHLYLEGRALYEYPCLKKSLYRFKYGGRREYGEFYGTEMAKHLSTVIRRWHPDAFVPVPLHSSRKRKRGYNQAEVLAAWLGVITGIPVERHLIIRSKKTAPQKNLDSRARQNNLKRAFKISENDVKLNTIIIIDDIYTTGSTIDAMASVLYAAGIKNIYFIALAIGRR